MFHFSRYCSVCNIYSYRSNRLLIDWVSPFGYLRIKACLRLPEAFRSLPRPSSPCVAKASSCCPSFVYLQTFSFFKIGLLLLGPFLYAFYSKIQSHLLAWKTFNLLCFLNLVLHTVNELNPFIGNMGPDGLEPSTPRLSSVCSNQLSYEPSNLVEPNGFEPMTCWMQISRSSNWATAPKLASAFSRLRLLRLLYLKRSSLPKSTKYDCIKPHPRFH